MKIYKNKNAFHVLQKKILWVLFIFWNRIGYNTGKSTTISKSSVATLQFININYKNIDGSVD